MLLWGLKNKDKFAKRTRKRKYVNTLNKKKEEK